MSEVSDKTKALEIALDKVTKDYANYKTKEPKPTWAVSQNDATADESIDRLITSSPAGSAQRQKYIDEKAAYHRKHDAWKIKFDQYEKDWIATRDAYQASSKLDPLLKKQQDNKDTGKSDPKTDAAVDALKQKVDAAPRPAAPGKEQLPPPPTIPPLPTDKDGKPIITGTPPKITVGPKAPDTKTGTSSTGAPTPLPASGPGSDPKGIWIDALKATFKTGIDDPKQKAQIDSLITQAKTEKWNEATFISALKNTTWWSQTLPTLRQFFLDTHDPRNAATFAQTMLNKVDTIQAKMEMLGIKVNDIDPVTGKVIDNTAAIKELAAQAIQNGWDDNQLAQHLATKSEVIFTGGGTLGGYMDQIKRQALNYGISFDKNQLDTINRDLLNPQDGKDAQWYLNNIKQQSIDANPAFAASLKEGRSLYDVTSSYRNQMSQLLEVDPTDITWNDLMNKVINKDKGTANTFADFTKLVKQDPLWQTTKNAKETYSNTALDLMKQFGFIG